MLSVYQKESLKAEINNNIREIYWRTIFTCKLLGRLFKKSIQRTSVSVNQEYDAGWDAFWKNLDYFSNDKYPFIENGKLIDPMISPYQYQLAITDKVISDYIVKYDIKSVLEVGSGTGLHLLNLASLFPEVHFYGLELTASGAAISRQLMASPPVQFERAHQLGKLSNVTIIQGNILESKTIKELQSHSFDLVFSTTVLEQLHNYLDVVFSNIFSLDMRYFLFHEQWLEFNSDRTRYRLLLDSDYFRAPLSILNHHPVKLIDVLCPSKQPIGMNLAFAFGEKVK